MDKIEAIKKVGQFKALLKNRFKLEKVYLYGSYANDTGREDSDIDVAIVVSNLSDDFFAINPMLWKLRRQVDDRIEPIIIDINHDKSGFLDEIKRTGIEIE